MISFILLGELASKSNSREVVKLGEVSRLIKSKQARRFQADAIRQIPVPARQRLQGPCAISVKVYYRTERQDLDAELLYDCLQDQYAHLNGQRHLVQGGIVRNDRQFREKHTYHHIDKRNPRVEVEIWPISGDEEGP